MKKYPFIAFLILLSACLSRKNHSANVPGQVLTIYLGEQETYELQIPSNSPYDLPDHSPHKLLLGLLASPSHLILRDGKIMMTNISMQQAVSPESGFLKIGEQNLGKWALVKGHWQGDLYEAEVLCVFEGKFSPLENNSQNSTPSLLPCP